MRRAGLPKPPRTTLPPLNKQIQAPILGPPAPPSSLDFPPSPIPSSTPSLQSKPSIPAIPSSKRPRESSQEAPSRANAPSPDPNRIVFAGLRNLGSTCYMNSILQVLIHCDGFIESVRTILDGQVTANPPPSNLGAMKTVVSALVSSADELSALSQELASTPSRSQTPEPSTGLRRLNVGGGGGEYGAKQRSIKPRGLLDAIRCGGFPAHGQQDAQEFLRFMLSTVHDLGLAMGQTKESTPSSRLFGGRLVSRIRCTTCEATSSREEQFFDVSLPVSEGTSLSYALQMYTKAERLTGSNKYQCEACLSSQEADRRLLFRGLPPLLTLHMNRFVSGRYGANKVTAGLPSPFRIRLSQWCEGACLQANDVYELFAVVSHQGGSALSGHYLCMLKKSSQWVMFDDSIVNMISKQAVAEQIEQARSGCAYILFYRRVMG